ncbi:hypothetical protein N752_21540 [Desulforamulus aquiferis]|nr:hypothetical protein N752_21540 [Desulforamulus aquiferis]
MKELLIFSEAACNAFSPPTTKGFLANFEHTWGALLMLLVL